MAPIAKYTLNNRGLRASAANGLLTQQTQAALKDFQKSENLQVQQRLKSRGFDAGEIDGRMGALTRAAIREFQRAENLPPTGRPDPQTLSALGISGPVAARQ